jgi:hypothetical protein
MLSAIRTDLLLELLPLTAAAVLVVSGVRTSTGFVAQTLESGERYAWTRDRIATFSRETVLRALFGLLRVIGHQPPSPVALRPAPGNNPLLLIPDPAWGPASFTFLARFLQARGLSPQVVRFRPEARSLAERADEVDAAIEAHRRATGSPQIDLVAAGAGGVITVLCLRNLDRAARVRRMVALGVPFRGTRMAAFRTDDGVRELRPGAIGLDALLPVSVPILSVWSTDDPEVVPPSSAVADSNHAVAVEGVGHLGMLLSARTFRAVHTALTDVHFEPAAATTGSPT